MSVAGRHETLDFKRVAVTGALGGIGQAVISELDALGAQVIAIDQIPQREGEALLKKMSLPNITYKCLDLTSVDFTDSLIHQLSTNEFPDALISLAGIVISGNIIEQSPENLRKVVEVNLISQMLLSQAFLQEWVSNSVSGNIVFVSSWVDHVPWPGITSYSTSKAGLVALCRGIAREHARDGIRANLVSPGIVDVGMAAKQWREEKDYRARATRAIPLGRLQRPEEVAKAISFLLSSSAQYMTGSNLLIDGGASLYPMDPEEI